MKAAVIGYGKSGRAAEQLLRGEGYTVIDIFDDGNAEMHPVAEFKDEYDCVVVSPGINLRKMANAPEIYTSEIELADAKRPTDTVVVAVTGTNGKSTVTTLIAQILKKCGLEAVACGNIGLPYAEAVTGGAYGAYVVELSSFQTGMLQHFSADCVVVTNLAEDHMDRYRDMDDYADDKMNLLRFLKPEGRLIIENDEYLVQKSSVYKGDTVRVLPEVNNGRLDFGHFYCTTDKFPLKGEHNLLNLSFALLAADSIAGLEGDVTYLTENLIGLEHRCEFAAEINGVEYINDSKGTNIHSTLTALKGLPEGIVIILGGKDKNGNFAALKDVINEKCAGVITYGQAGEKIYSTLKDIISVPLYKAEGLESAVRKGAEVAEAGQKVVLSPACASFDEHRGFEHRGAHFKELVQSIRIEEDE
ncbi:UDP-N-acetylmuramoylalanine/D-glutamate ligase [Denitrovibrio acetiphilus DSM 12809]|uniref:UDP-N-acetylmuramoylalanine--D-glutamate ligase n=1 Tax=Denitrovibrio acetiphilus (strain DSM 12809 / NBRC 114555 / N2460) TaxID=522772 RepID=D4H2U2_DENA2|nr:UDP-N-acetylmuramoyl-L-alanine--D-glutamate ligase [Denitrovibrio acetiphilus]ADD68965.1 UDP-N-acetylmuramoylalanine/D-glutamate ligase [Denitrovibrio acetiphilus DSM 12809]